MPNYLHYAKGSIGSFAWSFGMKSTSTESESAAETAWSTAVQAMFNSAGFNGILGTNVILTETYTSTASTDWKQTTATRTDLSIAGAAAASLPYQVAEVVTWRSLDATKYGHGRWYLPAVSPTALDTAGLILSSTSVGYIVTAVNAALASWAGLITPVILHRKGSLNGAVGVNSITPIASGDVSNKPVIQKRRGDKLTVARTALTF